jgi:hypothetical protein
MRSSPEIVSTIALILSFGSFGVAAYNPFRDRPRLKVTSNFWEESEWGPASIHAIVVNAGRRPVILRLLGGDGPQGGFSGTYLAHDSGGLRLGEHERHEFSIKSEDAFFQADPDGPLEPFARMWIEDSLGNRHAIPRSRDADQRGGRHRDSDRRLERRVDGDDQHQLLGFHGVQLGRHRLVLRRRQPACRCRSAR